MLMYQHYHGVDLVIYKFDLFLIFLLTFLDLKLEWNEEDRENVNVPMEIYEKACVIDATEGVEVR